MDEVSHVTTMPARTMRWLVGLNRLAKSDLAMLGALLMIYTFLRPYSGFYHDARLYQVQVLNRASEGRFENDLFFAYGSQDSYSLFSVIMEPVVHVFGISGAFLLGYLAAVMLLLWAEIRVVRRLIESRTLGNLSLLLLAATQLPFGYQSVTIHESFLTARLPAHACCLFALSMVLDRRWLPAFALSLVAFALHPLISVGPACAVFGLWVTQKLTTRQILWLITAGIVAVVGFFLTPVAAQIFHVMSPEWFGVVSRRNPMCLISEWKPEDLTRVILIPAFAILGAMQLSDDKRRLVLMSLGVGIAGVSLNILGEYTRIAILLQGQGFRWLWLINFLGVPLGLVAIRKLCRSNQLTELFIALLIVLILGNRIFTSRFGTPLLPLTILGWSVVAAVWYFVFTSRKTEVRERTKAALWGSLILIHVLMGLKIYHVGYEATSVEHREYYYSPRRLIAVQPQIVLLAMSVVIMGYLGRTLSGRKSEITALQRWVPFSLGVLSVTGLFVIHQAWLLTLDEELSESNLEFVKAAVLSDSNEVAEIYWPKRLREVWLELQMSCYYDHVQLAGAVFSEETALEGERRTSFVLPFEVDNLRRNVENPIWWEMPLKFLNADANCPPPTEQDLRKLASDERLDWIVLEDEFPGLYTATNGSLWIYNCRELRQRSGQSLGLAQGSAER